MYEALGCTDLSNIAHAWASIADCEKLQSQTSDVLELHPISLPSMPQPSSCCYAISAVPAAGTRHARMQVATSAYQVCILTGYYSGMLAHGGD